MIITRKLYAVPILCCLLVGVSRIGNTVTEPRGDPAAVELLKKSMDRYKGMESFEAACDWSESFGEGTMMTSKRTLTYARPNRWKVVSQVSSGMEMTSVSDGKSVVEYASVQREALTYSSPGTVADVATMQMLSGMMVAAISRVVDRQARTA